MKTNQIQIQEIPGTIPIEEINAAILDSLARDLALAIRQRRAAQKKNNCAKMESRKEAK